MQIKRLKENLKIFADLRLKPILGKNALNRHGGYMAGADKERASDLNKMFARRDIKAIICTRGGFNSNQILDLMDYKTIKKNPKIFIGFSDITVLLNAIFTKTNLITFHWSNIELLENKFRPHYKKIFAENFLTGGDNKNKIKISSRQILKKGKVSGILAGGNLFVLTTLIGTEYEPDWTGKIIFWEETGQTIEDIDFFLTHLRLAGVFEKIRGMIIGKITDWDILRKDDDWKKEKKFSIDKMILKACQNYKFPIIKDLDFGHNAFTANNKNIVLPIGVKATIDTSKKIFSIDENGVK